MADLSKLQQAIAAQKAKLAEQESVQQARKAPEANPEADKYAYLAPEPDFEPDPFDAILKDLSILTAYKLWCGKMTPTVRQGQKESIMVSCPRPSHRDSNPSAWVNTESNTWYCGTCQVGGDGYDIAAFKYGVENYRDGKNFGKLRGLMANDLGYGVAKIGGKDTPYKREEPSPQPDPMPESEPAKESSQPPAAPPPTATVIDAAARFGVAPEDILPVGTPALPGGVKNDAEYDEHVAEVIQLDASQIIFPTLNWRKIVTPGTFLDHYMAACTVDDIAEEYHFWNGLMALGLAAGRQAWLYDSPKVYANIFVCLLGLTGDGKSRSFRHLRKLLTEAIPYNHGEDYPSGANLMPTPSSAEVLINFFDKEVVDPSTNRVADYAPIRGLVEFGEMSELMSKAGRMGNTLKPTLIDLYDMKDQVSSASLTTGVKIARSPYCSVISSTQPSSLKTILGATDKASGFLNRWVFISGKAKGSSFFQDDVVDISGAVKPLQDVAGWAGGRREIRVDDDAITIMETFYHDVLKPLLDSNDSGMLSRMPLLYKKLLLIFAINEQKSVVDASIAEKVVSMHDYQLEASDLTDRNIGSDDQTTCYNDVCAQIERMTKNGTGPTLSQIKRSVARKNYAISLIMRSLKFAEDGGDVEIYAGTNKTGPPTQRYRWLH